MPPSFGGTSRWVRTLPLVGDPLAHAEDRCDRVEGAAHAGGERRPELQALAHERPALEEDRQARPFQMHRRGPPGLGDRRLSARERDRLEVGEALERRKVAAEELRAPERPIRPVAGAVEDERERGTLLAVLGEA